VGIDPTPEVVVVTFLAILELYKRGLVDIVQDAVFAEIVVVHLDEDEARSRGNDMESIDG
jgi:segregation and condensation protein A